MGTIGSRLKNSEDCRELSAKHTENSRNLMRELPRRMKRANSPKNLGKPKAK